MSTDMNLLIRIRADIQQAVSQLEKITGEVKRTGDSGVTASTGIKHLNKATEQAAHGASMAARAFRDLRDSFLLYYAGDLITRFTGGLVEANVAAQRIQYTFENVTGSAAGAREEFAFISETSKRLGLDLQSTAQSYARLAVSAKSAGLTQEQLHQGFIGLADAFTVLHTPAEDVSGLLIQLEQGMSLGKLQMQDFRAIAQHMPGTFELVSEAVQRMGGNLNDMLQHGGVPAKQFFQEFTALLRDKYGPEAVSASHSLNAELNRLHTTIFGLETQPSGFVESFTQSIQTLNHELNDPAIQQGLNNLIGGFGRFIDYMVKALALVGRFSSDLGVLVAKMQGFDASYPHQLRVRISQLKTEISRLQDTINAPAWKKSAMAAMFGQQMPEWRKNSDQLKVKLASLQKQLAQAQRELHDYSKPTGPASSGNSPLHQAGKDAVGTAHQLDQLNQFVSKSILDSITSMQTPEQLKSINAIIDSLRMQSATYGQTSREVMLYKLRTEGATSAQIAEARVLLDQIDKLKAVADAAKKKAEAEKQAEAQAKRHAKQLADDAQRVKDMLDPTLKYQRELHQITLEYQAGDLSAAQYQKAVDKVTKQLKAASNAAKKTSSSLNQFFVGAARGIQSDLANFLTNPFKQGLKGLEQAFAQTLQRMAAQVAAAQLASKMFGSNYGSSGQIGGWVGQLGSWVSHFFHDGGIVGSGGSPSMVPAAVFADAPRFHNGGFPGLRHDEVPAILQTGEQVLSRKQVAQGRRPITVHMTVHTPDATSFRRSHAQIAADLGAAIGPAMRRST